uniref:BTB/POZ domain-containing protein 19-like n=1 Tax=Ciona intestinalis TaxID=7719 RepID=UPI000180D2CE|nr:BTB/POZ domain-containing protein 19-like [Ciona intestinalis]|eukprot:XP_002129812.1 BTB/POZ domain-containing protein 19-like [Ciona intestinalis]
MDERLVRGDQTAFYSLMRKRCINNKDFSDAVFLVGPQRQVVYGHRCLLAARSETFRSMFSQMPSHSAASRESPINLPEVRPEVFLTALDYMYTNCCTLTSDLAPDVMSLSMEYNLDGLRKLSARFLLDGMNVETACDVLQSAVIHAQPDMLQKALDYCMKNAHDIFMTEKFNELSPETLGALLRGDSLEADELEVLNAIRKWARGNAIVAGRHMKEVSSSVIPLVRLPLVSPDELTKIEEENKKDMVIPMQQLAAAWRFHALKENTPFSYHTTLRLGTKHRESHKYLPKDK